MEVYVITICDDITQVGSNFERKVLLMAHSR